MRISVSVTNYSWTEALPAELLRLARQADDGGLDTLWVADHLMQAEPGTELTEPMLEAYATLGFLASATRRIRLGTMVSAVSFRPAALLVKAVTTIDVLSGGRAWLGLGAGYHQAEADMMGLPLPPTAERFAHLEDVLQLALRMWSGDDQPFDGTHTRAYRPIGSPLPVTRPHPPILIGGMGEAKTLRYVARYAQACNLFDIPDGGKTVRHKLAVLADHCAREGRSLADLDKTISTRVTPGETAAEVADRFDALAELGFDHVVVITSGPWRPETVDVLSEVAAR